MTAGENPEELSDDDVQAFAEKLVEWARTLSPAERRLVLALVARAAAEPAGDVHGFSNPFDSQIAAMLTNNLTFLAIQKKVQNVSQTTQLLSNIYKADSDAKLNLNAIRNVRS